jgi:hypothetical protein
MSISRWIVVVPVLVGLAVTGSAVARMMPRQTVRDTVYQTCQHNGVHFNKQGHANCGLHKGWSDDPTTAGDEPGSASGDQPTTESGGGSAGHAPKHGDKAGHGKGHGHHGDTTRGGSSGHGHGGGKSATHGGGHGHKTTHGGGHGHAGGQGHSHKKG